MKAEGTTVAERKMPRYPVYVPSKGRANLVLGTTFRMLMNDEVPFWVVVEPQEAEDYAKLVGEERVLVLPFANLGQGSIPARNWIKDHSLQAGHDRHWQLDDNIRDIRRTYAGRRLPVSAGLGFRVIEDFSDRYSNVGISGMNYQMFVTDETRVPFYLNVHVYSASLINNLIPYRWRGMYNEDTDLCLQVLSGGWCTILVNVFVADKLPTMKRSGGNTDELYVGDGRLKMARSLERQWPGVVKVTRRFRRAQHVITNNWKGFDTPLARRADFDWDSLPEVDEYGMTAVQVAPQAESLFTSVGDGDVRIPHLNRLPDKRLIDVPPSTEVDRFGILLREEGIRTADWVVKAGEAETAWQGGTGGSTPGHLKGDLTERDDLHAIRVAERAKKDEELNEDAYLAQLWARWVALGRRALRDAERRGVLAGVDSAADLGAGLGYSTAALNQMVLGDVVAEPLPLDTLGNGPANRILRRLSHRYGFDVVADGVGDVDLVFACGYFPCFRDPLERLNQVLQAGPGALLLVDTFSRHLIGHPKVYRIGDDGLSGAEASAAVAARLTDYGYVNPWGGYWSLGAELTPARAAPAQEPEAVGTPVSEPETAEGNQARPDPDDRETRSQEQPELDSRRPMERLTPEQYAARLRGRS